METPRIIDLSLPMFNGTPCYPGDPKAELSDFCTLDKGGFRVTKITCSTHQGTHVDAPSHTLEDGRTIDQMPLSAYFGPASVLRFPRERGGVITAADLAKYDSEIQPGARIIINTGWTENWPIPDYYDRPPAFSLDAVELIASRKVTLVGIDGPDIAGDEIPVHDLLLGAGIAIVENVANLRKCPDRFTFCALPLPLTGRDGSPVRAIAICE